MALNGKANGHAHDTRFRSNHAYADMDGTKETHLGPAYYSNPYSYRPYSPSAGSTEEAPLLLSVLSNLYKSAKDAFSSQGDIIARTYGPSSTSPRAAGQGNGSALDVRLPSVDTLLFIGLCALWYLSSAFSSNTGKSIMNRFKYPVTLTFIQFAYVSFYSALSLGIREHLFQTSARTLTGGASSHARTYSIVGGNAGGMLARIGIRKANRHMLHGTLIMSFFQVAGHVFSSMAIARVPVSTVHTIKALSPLFTVVSYVVLFRVQYTSATYVALVPLTIGVMLACSFDLRANFVGFLCALGSTVIFVSQNIFSKKLLPKETTSGGAAEATSSSSPAKLDKLNLLFYSSGMAFLLMIPMWLWSDAATLLAAWAAPPTPTTPAVMPLVGFFFLNGTVHFAQNLIAFAILARTSPVTYSIASLIKRIAVICIAIVYSGQSVTFIQGFGMAMTFGGLWMYNKAKSEVDKGEQKRIAVENKGDVVLPISASAAMKSNGAAYHPSPRAPAGSYAPLQPPPPQQDLHVAEPHRAPSPVTMRNRSLPQVHAQPPPVAAS